LGLCGGHKKELLMAAATSRTRKACAIGDRRLYARLCAMQQVG